MIGEIAIVVGIMTIMICFVMAAFRVHRLRGEVEAILEKVIRGEELTPEEQKTLDIAYRN